MLAEAETKRYKELKLKLEDALMDIAFARDKHWNAVPEDRLDGLQIYDDIISRLQGVLGIETQKERDEQE